MKTLVIGPYKDMSGYAALARAYTKSLIKVSNKDEICAASLRYDSGSLSKLDDEILMAHKNKISEDVEVILQIATPNEMRAVAGKRNIALCCWETDRIPLMWVLQLNAFDAIIVPCEANKIAFKNSGVSKPIYVLPMPFFKDEHSLKDVKKYILPSCDENTTVYYNIAQWSHKKGLDAAIRSYFLAFQNDENVVFLLKGYVGMLNQQGDANKLLNAIGEIKNAMRLPKYPKLFLSDSILSNEDVKRIHATGDCYVNMTRGEGWCIPAFDAALYGKELITTIHTAMSDWVDEKYVFKVDSVKDAVHNMHAADKTIYTSKECWYEPIIISGATAFKEHFNSMAKNNTEFANKLHTLCDPTTIGTRLKDIINAKE